MCCIPAAGIAKCPQLTSSFQVRQHELPFPTPIMVKIKATGPLSSSWAGQDANQGQHSSFLPHMSVPFSSNTGVLYTATSAAHRTHDIQEEVKEDPKSFLLSSYLDPAPLATTADTATMAPPFILSYSYSWYMFAFTSQQGEQGWTISYDSKTNAVFFPFIVPCLHAISLIQYF